MKILVVLFVSFLLLAPAQTNDLVTAHFKTNHIVSDANSQRSNCWYHTNITTKVTIIRFRGETITNSVPIKTNVTKFTVQKAIIK